MPNHSKFSKQGGNDAHLSRPIAIRPATGQIHSGFQEHSNVDPTIELAQLMDTQRQLEANANMIKYQDTMLQRLVNDVGKIT